MPIQHLLLALLVISIWGINFVFIKVAMTEISPLLLCSLRFILAWFPAIFLFKPPKAPFNLIISYAMLMFAIQFSLLFMGMHAGMTAGMASLLTQVQVFFSMIFAAIILREVPNTLQLVGAVVAFAGIGLIARHLDSTITLTGFILIIAAAASWGMGNLVTKKIGHVNMLSLVVWGSFFASFPLTLFTLLIDGPQHMLADFHRLTWVGMSAILYIVYGSTWVGYGVWNWLVSRHSVPVIVPFTLLVPVVGMLSSVLFYHEPFQTWKLLTGIFIITGLCINILGARLSIKRSEKALASS